MLFDSFTYDLFCRYHHTHIDNLVIVAGHDHTYDILSDIMYIAFYRSQKNFSCMLVIICLFSFYIGLQNSYSLFHRTCGLHHLRQKHLSLTKQFTHGIHACH